MTPAALLLLKLILVPALIAVISLAGQRFGTTVAGLMAGFPIVAGPIFVILTAEHGAAFGATAAAGTLMGVASLGAFMVVYAWLCRSWHWLPCVIAGWVVFLGGSLALQQLPYSFYAASLTGLLVPLVGPRLFPPAGERVWPRPMPLQEIILRMAAAGALVLVITGAAQATGPKLAGLLTPVPVATSVLAGFSHRFGGPAAAIQLLRAMLGSLYGFAVFFIVAGYVLPDHGLVLATLLGLAGALAVQAASGYAMFRFR